MVVQMAGNSVAKTADQMADSTVVPLDEYLVVYSDWMMARKKAGQSVHYLVVSMDLQRVVHSAG